MVYLYYRPLDIGRLSNFFVFWRSTLESFTKFRIFRGYKSRKDTPKSWKSSIQNSSHFWRDSLWNRKKIWLRILSTRSTLTRGLEGILSRIMEGFPSEPWGKSLQSLGTILPRIMMASFSRIMEVQQKPGGFSPKSKEGFFQKPGGILSRSL